MGSLEIEEEVQEQELCEVRESEEPVRCTRPPYYPSVVGYHQTLSVTPASGVGGASFQNEKGAGFCTKV